MARPKAEQEETRQQSLTPEQLAISERVSSQETGFFDIDVKSINDFSLMNMPLNLDPNYPIFANLQKEKKYVFRWCERTPEAVDKYTRSVAPPLKWAIVNRQTLPESEPHIDPILGCVCCLDQMLLFKPYAHAEMVKRAKNEISDARARTPKANLSRDKIDVVEGEKYKINGGDIVEYEDSRELSEFVEE